MSKITLPSGVQIETDAEVKIGPDGSLILEGPPQSEDVVHVDPVDLLEEEDDTDAAICMLLDPNVDGDVFLRSLDQMLNITDTYFDVVRFMFNLDDKIHYQDLATKMGITEPAAMGRVFILHRLNLICRVSRGNYVLDGAARSVLNTWREEVIAERARRAAIARFYKLSVKESDM